MFTPMCTPCLHLCLHIFVHLCLHHVYTNAITYVYTMFTHMLTPCSHLCLHLSLHHVYIYVYTYVNTMFTSMFTAMFTKCLHLCLHYKLFPHYPLYNLTEMKWGQVIIGTRLTKVVKRGGKHLFILRPPKGAFFPSSSNKYTNKGKHWILSQERILEKR